MLEPDPRSPQGSREGLGIYGITRGEQDKQQHRIGIIGSSHRVALPPCPARLLVPAQARLLRWDTWGPREFSSQTERGRARADERSERAPFILSWLEIYSQGSAAEGL